MKKASFNAIFAADCKILILGSLPGDASLNAGQYYAHPRNAFWPIMSQLINQDLCVLPFNLRYAQLIAHGIGLWDVVAQAQRPGSLDAAISAVQLNPLSDLCAELSQLKLVAFNGKTAAKLGNKLISGYIPQAVMPSTSPAYTLPLSQKSEQWLAHIRPYLNL